MKLTFGTPLPARVSAGTGNESTVNIQSKTPLTASVESAPPSHNGSDEFRIRIAFSEEPKTGFSYTTMRDHAFTVTGGSVKGARRLEPPSNVGWEGSVKPDSNDDDEKKTAADAMKDPDDPDKDRSRSTRTPGQTMTRAEIHRAAREAMTYQEAMIPNRCCVISAKRCMRRSARRRSSRFSAQLRLDTPAAGNSSSKGHLGLLQLHPHNVR